MILQIFDGLLSFDFTYSPVFWMDNKLTLCDISNSLALRWMLFYTMWSYVFNNGQLPASFSLF